MTDPRSPAVLLVDDRPENLLAHEAVLQGLDCRLVKASSGPEALKILLEGDDFAVILLDVQMPELDGFETAEYIKQRERTADIPIIFVTAISKEEHHVFRGYETGAVDYLFKPFEPIVLRSKVSVFLELHRAARELRESRQALQATFDCAPIGMARLDRDGRVIEVNRALSDTLGIPAADLVRRTLDELTHPDDVGFDAAQRKELLAGTRRALRRREAPARQPRRRDTGPASASRPRPRGPATGRASSSSRSRTCASAAAPSASATSSSASRPRASRPRRPRSGCRRCSRSPTRRSPTSASRSWCPSCWTASPTRCAPTASRWCWPRRAATTSPCTPRAAWAQRSPHSRRPTGDRGLAERVERLGDVLVINDLAQMPEIGPHLLGEAIVSVMAAPLVVEGRAIGALEVGSILARDWLEDEVGLLRLAADRAALVLERAQLYEQEHAIARELQSSLLPDKLPEVPGLVMATRYLPGGAGARVGGDWYDAIALPGARLAIVMGDVAGHGIRSASIMGQLRSATRAHVLEGASPAEVLEKVNRFLLTLDVDSMATVLVCLVEPATGTVLYANAGHCLPLVRAGKKQVSYLDSAGGVPLGALDAPEYQNALATFGAGDTLVLYTDGLVEERGQPYTAGLAHLEDATRDAPLDPDAVCNRILREAVGDGVRDDDVTLLVLQVLDRLEDRLELEVVGDHDALQSMRAMMRRWLREATQDEEIVADITMAANEAVQNAIEHAHHLDRTKVQVELRRENGAVTVSVRDHGRWRDGDHSEERGRGLDLMRALMDGVEIEPRPSGSTVTLRHRLRSRKRANRRGAPAQPA